MIALTLTTMASTINLQDMASELRKMIFQNALVHHPEGDMHIPALIIALRPHTIMYKEVLRLYYTTNVFVLDVWSQDPWQFNFWSEAMLASIRKLRVVVA